NIFLVVLVRTRGRGNDGFRQAFVADRRRQVLSDFLGLREFVQIVQTEAHQKLRSRPVEERSSHDRLFARRRNELLLEECLDDGRGVDPSDLLDLRERNRLAVCDDRERLEGRERKAAPLSDLVKSAQQRVELRARHEPPSSCYFFQTDSPFGPLGGDFQPPKRASDRLARRLQHVREILFRDGTGGREKKGLEGGADFLRVLFARAFRLSFRRRSRGHLVHGASLQSTVNSRQWEEGKLSALD